MSGDDRITVLGVGAHPADVFTHIGGTLANHAKRGDNVIAMTLTYGLQHATTQLVGKTIDEIRRIIKKQTAEGAAILGASECRFLDFGDEPLVSTREKLIELGQVIQEIKPDILVSAHIPEWEKLGGGDHGEAARMVEQASTALRHARKAEAHPRAVSVSHYSLFDRLYRVNQPLVHVPTTFVDVTETIGQKIDALVALWGHTLGSFDPAEYAESTRQVHRVFGSLCGFDYAEPFVNPREQVAVKYLS